ncbi:uncharacterized protein VP01_2995g2, partial [Puccinia sorghi]
PRRAPSSTTHPLPEQFDGTCGPAAQAFLQHTGLYCHSHLYQLPDDCSKIIFMLTNLSGNTTKWAQPINQRPNSSPVSTATSSTLSAKVRPSKPSVPSSNPAMWIPTLSSSMSMPMIPIGAKILSTPEVISP